jgi:threonine/homoserine/homoserine lactone efflux protein
MHLAASLLGITGTAFVVALSGAVMPGPLLAVTVRESSRRGAAAGPLLVLGHMVLEAALVAAIAVGLTGFLHNAWVTGLLGIVGGATMCWMGQGMLRSARGATLVLAPGARGGMHPVAAGIVVSLSNPYWTMWWATIGTSYVVAGLRQGIPGVVAFFAGHILGDLAWYTLVSVGVARNRRLLSDRAYAWILGGCGAALVAFGVWFVRAGSVALGKGLS